MSAHGDTPGAVVYEVNLELDAAIRDAYLHWLDAHVLEICALPGFTGAQLFGVDEPAAESGRVSLCVQYTLHDTAALETYLRDHAPRLRADGIVRFGDRVRASRRVLRALPGVNEPDRDYDAGAGGVIG